MVSHEKGKYADRVQFPLSRRDTYAGKRRQKSRPVKTPYPGGPPVKDPIAPDELVRVIDEGKQKGEHFNLIVSVAKPLPSGDEEGGVRAVAAKEWEHTVLPLVDGMQFPEFGTQYHVTKGTPFGENSNMIDDYESQRQNLSAMLENKIFCLMMEKAFGPDWRNADDRWSYREKNRAKPDKDLTVHVDHPKWKRHNTKVPVEAAQWPAGHFSIIALNQSKPHGIPSGGHSDSGHMIYSMFVSPLSKEAYAKHCTDTLAAFHKQCEYAAAGKKNVYMWKKLCKLNLIPKLEAQHLFAAYMMYGMRPILYPSGKPIDAPQTYSKPYAEYVEYGPDETRQIHDPATEIATVPARFRRYFADVFAVLPDEKLACALSTLTYNYFYRTLDQTSLYYKSTAGYK